jgi:hypothetical protein
MFDFSVVTVEPGQGTVPYHGNVCIDINILSSFDTGINLCQQYFFSHTQPTQHTTPHFNLYIYIYIYIPSHPTPQCSVALWHGRGVQQKELEYLLIFI